jgi:hypothetical protein
MSSHNPERVHPRRAAACAAVAMLFPLACAAVLRPWGRTAAAPEGMNEEVCQLNQRALERARDELRRDPNNHRLSVRLIQTHLARVYLGATAAYERQHQPRPDGEMPPNEEYLAWRRNYLRADPEHAARDALCAVRSALRRHPPDRERGQLLSVLASVLCCLGRHREEVAALRQLADVLPDPTSLAGRLARAYAEAGQFHRAEAIRRADDRPARW